MTTYTLVYPPAHNDTYVKATTKYSTATWPYFATDPAKSLTGSYADNSWLSGSGTHLNQRFHIDLGDVYIIRRIYYENYHSSGSGTTTNRGARNFTMQGSNSASAFAQLTYATDTDWTGLTTDATEFDIHASVDASDPKYILVSNTVAYRYYAIKVADNWGAASLTGIRRIVMQTEDGYSPLVFTPGVIWF